MVLKEFILNKECRDIFTKKECYEKDKFINIRGIINSDWG